MKKLLRIILIAVGALALGAGGTFGAYEIIGNETAFSQDAYTLCIGETVGTNGIGDSFLSLDESIVRIDEQGVLTGVSKGNTVISRKKGLFAYYANVSVNDHIPDREADCENPSVCAACGKVLAEAYGHDFTEATCTEDSVCRRCNKLNKLAFGHSFTEATCTEDSHCTTCGFVAGAPLGHDFTLPTCTEDSFCTRCKIPGTENALGHDFIDATCVAPKTCVRCNETEGEPLGHNPAEYVCEKDTLCKRCGEVLEKAAPHQWTEATCTKPETCTVCNKTKGKALGHDYTQATCTKKATCTRCGKTTGYLSNHDYVIKKTYSDDSYTYYDYECSMCKDYFTYKGNG